MDDQGNTLATFKTTVRFNGEAKAKQLAEEMNREAADEVNLTRGQAARMFKKTCAP